MMIYIVMRHLRIIRWASGSSGSGFYSDSNKHEPLNMKLFVVSLIMWFLPSRLPYNQYFGGVSSLSKEQYLKINGFPNNYWGWGGEDDDIYNR